MVKKRGVQILLVLAVMICSAASVLASDPSINNITLQPDLNLAYFGSYNITANVTNSSPLDTVALNVSIINGDGGSCGQFYVNGSCSESGAITYNMTYVSQDTYRQTGIRPDNIYPEIEFAKDTVFWRNSPQNITLTKDNIHLMHFANNYSDAPNMSFWIEFDAAPANPTLTKDLVVYVIEHGHNISYFAGSDWRNNANEVSLVATLTRTTPKSHIHTSNSSHYLITLSADNNGTIGSEHVNISGDFWIALYSNAPANQGWNLAYRNDTLCNNTARWYREQQGTWTPTNQSGCPDNHIHIARRIDIVDGLQASITANYTDGNSTTNTTNWTFAGLPNLPPVPTAFTYPQNGTYSGLFNITWIPASDPNGDPVTYNLSLLNADGTFNQTLNTSTNFTSFYWNSSTVADGVYDLMIVACDPSNNCSNFTLGGLYDNFTVDNNPPIVTLISPANGTSSPANAYNFSFNVSDVSNISSCILIFNSSVINNLTAVYLGAVNNFSNTSLPIGTFNWSVNCTDIAGFTANSGSFELTITPLYNFTNISLIKADFPDPVEVGNLLNYTINVTSTGNGTAYSVVVNDTYPGAAEYVSSSPSPIAGTNNAWSLGNLPSSTSILINITVNVSLTVPNGTYIINSVNASYQNETGAELSLVETQQTRVLNSVVLNTSNISVAKTDDPDPVIANHALNYTITVTSSGDATAYNVTLNETYPLQVIYLSSQPAPVSGTNNSWVLGNLTPGTAIDVNISVQVPNLLNGTVINNTVNATFQNSTGAVLTAGDTESTLVLNPPAYNNSNISVTKTNSPDPVDVNTNLVYTINVTANGNGTAYNVTLTDTYSLDVIYVSAQPTPSSGNNTWVLGNLAAGTGMLVNITVLVRNVANGTAIANSVSADFQNETGGTSTRSASSSATAIVPPTPPAPSGGGGGGGSSSRSFYSSIARRQPIVQSRQEETALAAKEETKEKTTDPEENKQEQLQNRQGITGSAVRIPDATPYASVSRMGIWQSILIAILALAIAGILGTVALTKYAYYSKPKVVVTLHRGNTHSHLVIMLKRSKAEKNAKPDSSDIPQ